MKNISTKVFKGATIYPVDGPKIEDGVMIVEGGKIKAIGSAKDVEIPAVEAPGGNGGEAVEVIDISGKVILPGFVDAHSHVGVWGDGEGSAGYDGNEMGNPIAAKVSALDATNPEQVSFAGAREGGITSLQIIPGSGNPVGGLAFACKTAGTIIDDMVIKNPTGLKGALGENPKRAYGQFFKKAPMTRMGTAGVIRDYFYQVKEYMAQKEAAEVKAAADADEKANDAQARAGETEANGNGGNGAASGPDYNPGLEAGALVMKGEIPFRVHAHRYDDIITAVRICEEFDIPFSIEHCTTGFKVAQFLGERGVFAHVGPGLFSRGKQELADADERNPALLDAAGVKVCLITDHPFLDSRYLLPYAAVAHKHGMPLDRVLRALTLNPAESLGIDDRVGSLAPGKDADFVIMSGEPFTYTSVILSTHIEGEEVYTRPTI